MKGKREQPCEPNSSLLQEGNRKRQKTGLSDNSPTALWRTDGERRPHQTQTPWFMSLPSAWNAILFGKHIHLSRLSQAFFNRRKIQLTSFLPSLHEHTASYPELQLFINVFSSLPLMISFLKQENRVLYISIRSGILSDVFTAVPPVPRTLLDTHSKAIQSKKEGLSSVITICLIKIRSKLVYSNSQR